MTPPVLVVGAGLAGLSATVALAARGAAVTLLESRPRLGGRAGSFTDAETGELVDACQHVGMGCCSALADFFRTVGVGHLLAPQPALTFVTPDRRRSRFAADPWPAPFHLGRALLGTHTLTASEKLRVAYGLGRMLLEPPDADPPLLPWLLRHRQTPRTLNRFWGVVLVSALNETLENVGLKYARKVFVDGFMASRNGWRVEVPSVPLGRLYGPELAGWLKRHNVEVRLNSAVRAVDFAAGRATGVTLRSGETLPASAVVLAVPWHRAPDLLPPDVADAAGLGRVAELGSSPITSVHLWLDRPVLDRPHLVLVDCLGHWVFSRGETSPGRHYLQVVVSASRELHPLGGDEVARRVEAELRSLLPAMRGANVLRRRVVTEHRATYRVIPGVDELRPAARTPIPNLALAGDWTRTGWPATMEGAVRGGLLAAAALAGEQGPAAVPPPPAVPADGLFGRLRGARR